MEIIEAYEISAGVWKVTRANGDISFVPADPANRDYDELLQWLAQEGNQ